MGATAGFIVWSIFGFIAIGWSWKFAWESEFTLDDKDNVR